MQIGSEQFRGKFVSRNKLPLPVDNKGRSTDFGQHLADAVRINGALYHHVFILMKPPHVTTQTGVSINTNPEVYLLLVLADAHTIENSNSVLCLF